MSTQIAAQLYTLRDFTKTAEDFAASMAKLQKIGYQAVQISAIGPIDYREVKKITDEYGMKIIVSHTPNDRLFNDLSQVIAEHKHWDCGYIGLGAMPVEMRKDPQLFIDTYKPIAQEIAKEGLKFVYHNHRFEFEKFDGKTCWEMVCEQTSPEEFGFFLDTYWIQAGGCNPAQFIKQYADRLDIVHLKDMQIIDDNQTMAEVGEGNMDWSTIIPACKEAGVKWYAIEQDVCYRDPFESLEISFNNVKKMGLE